MTVRGPLVLAAIAGVALTLQLGFLFLGWSELVLPTPGGTTELGSVWPPAGLYDMRLGDAPITGLPFLLAILSTLWVAWSACRHGKMRLAMGAVASSLLLSSLAIWCHWLFVQDTGRDPYLLSSWVFLTMGMLTFFGLAGVLLLATTLVLLSLQKAARSAAVLLPVGLVYWAGISLGWAALIFAVLFGQG